MFQSLEVVRLCSTSLYDTMFEELPVEESFEEDGGLFGEVKPQRPIGMRFQFIEVCGGSGVVTKELIKLGIICGPALDLSISKQYDVKNRQVLQWVVFLLEEDRLDSFLVAPPCTTFSPAAHLCCRSYEELRGFLPLSEKALQGNFLAFAALFLIMVALRMKKIGLLEQPRRSKRRRLSEWQRLVLLGAVRAGWLLVLMEALIRRSFSCCGHTRRFSCSTRSAAGIILIYPTPGLAKAFARFFHDHLAALASASRRLSVNVEDLEDLLTNELCCSLLWKVSASWRWKNPSHINVLELKISAEDAEDCGCRRRR